MITTVSLNDADIKRAVEGLRKKFPFAIKRALKRAGTSARAEMTKLIGADTGLPAKRIKDAVRIDEVGDSSIAIVVTGRRIPLIDFRARGPEPSRGKGRGVAYKLPGGRGRDPHAFIATMPSGHRGVFKRAANSMARKTAKGWSAGPIVESFGPSLVRVFEKFLPEGAIRGQQALLKNLRSEIDFALSKR